MARFVHQRHKPPRSLQQPRQLVVACAPMRSNINISRILRACGCCAVSKVICCGSTKIVSKVARDGANSVHVETRSSVPPVLAKMRQEGYRLVGLEQASGSQDLTSYRFQRKTVLVIGNERQGLSAEVLEMVDDVVEIPIYGLPHSHNVATAAAIVLYEYCRQFPDG